MDTEQVRFTLDVHDDFDKFEVGVRLEGRDVFTCGWKGGNFNHGGREYVVLGPYQRPVEGKYRVYELTPVSDLV